MFSRSSALPRFPAFFGKHSSAEHRVHIMNICSNFAHDPRPEPPDPHPSIPHDEHRSSETCSPNTARRSVSCPPLYAALLDEPSGSFAFYMVVPSCAGFLSWSGPSIKSRGARCVSVNCHHAFPPLWCPDTRGFPP